MSCQSVLLGLSLALATGHPVLAQDDADEGQEKAATKADVFFDTEPDRCIPLNRVRRTEIIDDQTIVFYVSRNDAFINNLPRRCPGLRTNSRFMYEVNQSRLCETDWITVLERFGTTFSRGFNCRLGVFHPASAEIVASIKEAAETGMSRPAATATPVEMPVEDESDDETSEQTDQE